jgi:hypothetical protein
MKAQIKMPPQGKLPAETIAAIREWVMAGAPSPAVTPSAGQLLEGTGVRPVALRGVITDFDKNFWSFKAHFASPRRPPRYRRIGRQSDRPVHSRQPRKERSQTRPARPTRPRCCAAPPSISPAFRPPKKSCRISSPTSPQGFRKGGRPPARLAPLRRTLGPALARRDALCRFHRQRRRPSLSARLALSRLRVQAFNDDMPYNQFVREQLAGDILAADPNSGVGYRGIVATGFLALGKKALAQKDLPLKRYDVVDDQIDVTAKAFLGLTVTCARCHDHKFDPIATKDYYQMAAIFASTLSYEKGETGDPIQTPLARRASSKLFKQAVEGFSTRSKRRSRRSSISIKDARRIATWKRPKIADSMLAAYRVYAKARALAVAAETKLDEKQLARWVEYLKDPSVPNWRSGAPPPTRTVRLIAAEYQEEFRRSAYQYDQDLSWWKRRAAAFPAGKVAGPRPQMSADKDPFFVAVWQDGGPLHRSREEQIARSRPKRRRRPKHAAGTSRRDGEDAPHQGSPHGVRRQRRRHHGPENLPPRRLSQPGRPGGTHRAGDPSPQRACPAVKTKSGRLELADWIVDPRNPLPARVMANRIWQGHFGDGIVRTPDNYGRLGERPQ